MYFNLLQHNAKLYVMLKFILAPVYYDENAIDIRKHYYKNMIFIYLFIYLFIYTIFREGYTFSYKPVYQVALYKQLIKHNTTIYKLYIKYKIMHNSREPAQVILNNPTQTIVRKWLTKKTYRKPSEHLFTL